MYEVLTKKYFCLHITDSGNIFNAKSKRRLPHNFRVGSQIFKDDESETGAKTNSRHRVCPLLIRSPLLACTEYAQSLLFAHYVNTHKKDRVWLKEEYACSLSTCLAMKHIISQLNKDYRGSWLCQCWLFVRLTLSWVCQVCPSIPHSSYCF